MSSGSAPQTTSPVPSSAEGLTPCEREPIHAPGTIQPHGALLAVDPATLEVVACSANAAAFFGAPPESLIGQPVASAPLPGLCEALAAALAGEGKPWQGWRAVVSAADGTPCDVLIHAHAGLAFVEVESAQDGDGIGTDLHNIVHRHVEAMRDAASFEGLAAIAARAVRDITGFERVLVYRFDLDGHGDVVGEDRTTDWNQSFLGFRFPSTDIPVQARALYAKTRLRLAPDRDAAPVPIIMKDRGAPPLDIGFAHLRAQSPVHLDYHRNMGVNGSLSASIMKGGELWGLIVAHSRTPHRVGALRRSMVAMVADAFSLGLDATESAEERANRTEHVALHARLLEQIAGAEDFVEALTRGPVKLTDLFYASSGVAVVNRDTITTVGDAPPVEAVEPLVAWLRGVMQDDVYATDCISAVFPPFAAYHARASGLLAVLLGDERQHMIIWFRPEIERTITWGGDPRKPRGDDPHLYLPRKSFERWVEVKRGHARPWPRWKIEIARSLRVALTDLILRQMRRISQLNEQLAQANRAKSDFLANMSHELRTPLNAIIGFAQIMQTTKPGDISDKHREYVGAIAASGEHLLELINDVLDLSKVEARRLELFNEELDVGDAIAEARALQEHALATARIAFVRDLPSPSPLILVDRRALRQMLLNLISNAIKFTPADGVITVSVARDWRGLALTVADNGVGIPAEDLPYVLEPFRQSSNVLTASQPGTGLGLPIVKSLMEAHGGVFDLESAVGVGTRATLRFPPDRVVG